MAQTDVGSEPRPRRRGRAVLITLLIVALVVVGAGVALVVSGELDQLDGVAAARQATAQAQAQASAAVATLGAAATAQALAASMPYAPVAIGPCDPQEQWTSKNQYYWAKSAIEPKNAYTCSADSIHFANYLGDYFMVFYGRPAYTPNGFPARFTVAMTFTYDAGAAMFTNISVGFGYSAGTRQHSALLNFSPYGYNVFQYNGQPATPQPFRAAPWARSSVITLLITVDGRIASFSVNGHILTPTVQLATGVIQVTDLKIDVSEGQGAKPGAGVTISHFVLTPLSGAGS